jgi:hypothetical protein
MQAISAITEDAEAGLKVVYSGFNWLVAQATSPEVVLKYDRRLADLGCLDCLDEAGFFAAQRCFWIVERQGVLVATLRWSNDEYDKLFWKRPDLIEIAACPPAWKTLPVWVQTPIWQRLVAFVQGQEPIVHDRPELRRMAEATFRATVERAIGNRDLLEELFEDCPFWRMDRDELLDQDPGELRLWYRLLRLPKSEEVRSGITDFVRALRHAAGLIRATASPDQG